MSQVGLAKIEGIYRNRIAPQTVKVLMKVYGVTVDIYRIKNKKIANRIRTEQQKLNKFSREIYQNESLFTNDLDEETSVIDSSTDDYASDLDIVGSDMVLLTTQTFESFSGFIAGMDEDFNVYCLTTELRQGDVLESKSDAGVVFRCKIKEVQSIGRTTSILKKYIATSLVF